MTLRTNARIAGVLFLLYIATGIASMILFNRALAGAGDTPARLASIAQHATLVRLTVVLALVTFVYAVGLGVTLQALTRDQDRDVAMMAMLCRVSEGVIGAVAGVRTLGLVSVATEAAGAVGTDAASAHALGALLLKQGGWTGSIGAACFAVGSTLFCWLFLRGRGIPLWLAWLGLLASLLLVVAIPMQLLRFVRGAPAFLVWIPMAVFEVVLAVWLIVKGVAPPGRAAPVEAGPAARALDSA